MKQLFLLALTLSLTLAAVASTQAGEKKRAKNSGGTVSYAKAVGPTQRQGGSYSGGRTSYVAPRHGSRHVNRVYGSPVRHSKHGSHVHYY